ncbi:hypothetical protein [Mycobacterium stomatepiae]|uniref:Uncharacterized protein n=1 Tax=Mycobacterium stomatepiae TaxID=470076 RepID=A0A7I7Q8D9_9MYCO|nr:hypothetical protein MSTO_27830 [Mycobacterium stomatepiae]
MTDPYRRFSVRLHEHTGVLILWVQRSVTFTGTLEQCEQAYRKAQLHCLLAGWWGLVSLFLLNPIALISNYTAIRKVRALAKEPPGPNAAAPYVPTGQVVAPYPAAPPRPAVAPYPAAPPRPARQGRRRGGTRTPAGRASGTGTVSRGLIGPIPANVNGWPAPASSSPPSAAVAHTRFCVVTSLLPACLAWSTPPSPV